MSEFIINSDQLERLIEGIEHKTDRKINRVVCNDKELPSIVRCRDCKYYDDFLTSCEWWGAYERLAEPDGFCAWGERMSE